MADTEAAPDLSAIGTEIVPSQPTIFAIREEKAFELDRVREDNRHALDIKKSELGAIGRVFGSRENAITYVIAFLVVFSLISIAIISFSGAANAVAAIEIFKGIAYAGTGYLTGKSLEAKKD